MINFDELTHTYTNDGKTLISVTQLMQKQGLSPDYSKIKREVLNAKAERGSLIHKEIEEFNKNGEIGFTKEMQEFKSYIEKNGIEVIFSEAILYNDVVAGTADLITYKNGVYTIADIKTTSELHQEAVSWQLSIYAYLFNQLHTATSCKVEKGEAYHFDKDGNLKVVNIMLKPVDIIEKLIACERKGEAFTTDQITLVDDNTLQRLGTLESLIKELDERKKEADKQAKELKEVLLNAMQEKGLKSFETEAIKLTVKEAYTRATIDSASLKKDMPEIAEKYTKTSETKASLLITLKEAK